MREVVEIRVAKDDDGQIILTAGGAAIIGIDGLSIGGDERGSFMDIRLRHFEFGIVGQNDADDEDEREEERIEG